MTSWKDYPMSPEERNFWHKIGRDIAKAREKHTKHGLDDDRRTRAITQTSLGKAIGLSRPSIANIERGAQRIDLYTHKLIMDFLSPDNSEVKE